MSVVFSGTNQGSFISTGGAQIIQLRSDVDWMYTYNYTQIAANSLSTGYQFYWQRGMAVDTGLEYESNAGGTAVNIVALASGGFTLVNNTINTPGALVATSAISGANPPVVSTGSTAGLSTGSIVRIYNTPGALQLGSLDFTVGTVVASTSFTLAYMRAIVATTSAGHYAIIPYNPYFYPPTRVISKINRANSLTGAYDAAGSYAIITLTVNHFFTVGQRVRLILPTVTTTAFGMPSLNQVECTIVAIDESDIDGEINTITVNVNITNAGTFAWPLTTDPAFTPPQVVPVGQDSGFTQFAAASYIGDSEINEGYIGISLAGGKQSPAGQASDVIYWVAGKSVNT
jgi:hypothetical protein